MLRTPFRCDRTPTSFVERRWCRSTPNLVPDTIAVALIGWLARVLDRTDGPALASRRPPPSSQGGNIDFSGRLGYVGEVQALDASDTSGKRLSVVIPAFNEAGRLEPTLDRVTSFLAGARQWRPAEILVVDDGSSDLTAELARSHTVIEGVDLVVAVHPVNRGKGAAVRTGFSRSSGEWVLLTDADMSAPIEDLTVLAAAAEPDAVAVGSRAVDRRLVTERQPLHRDLMGRTFNLAIRALGLTRLSDTQCGFKLFPGDLARRLASAQQLDGFSFDVELLVLARHWGYHVEEVGVHWQHVEASRVMAIRHSSQMLRDALKLWWWRTSRRLPAEPRGVS